jgi:hypothetical protein
VPKTTGFGTAERRRLYAEATGMSSSIDTNRVTEVLLSDGWHRVDEGSLTLDLISYREGAADPWLHPETGFIFVEQLPADTHKPGSKITVAGPLASLHAVRMR